MAAASDSARDAPFNPNQARSIFVRLGHIDRQLLEIDQTAQAIGSPFMADAPDVFSDEAALLRMFIARAREALLAALRALDIPQPAPEGSARWHMHTALTFADVTLQELTPGFLRGYGALSEEGATRITAVTRRLRELLREGTALLHEHDPGGIADRVTRLPGIPGDILRTLYTLSTTRHLEALRPLIAAAVDRAEDVMVTLGVFGRVSVGKSSLINAVIGAPILPVGVTPVTAVPIRVEHGDSDRTVVEFFSGEQQTVPTETLPVYVTEQQNPNNTRGIRAVTVTVPSMLPDLRILDTPGVGSLSATGPAQTLAWLPRCDLGLVLIAPGTPVGRDELALVSGLMNAGIPCRVLLSKADTVPDTDVESAMAYIAAQLHRVLGETTAIPLSAVSAHPDHAAGLAHLRHEVVEPLARDHAQQRRHALAQRLTTLILSMQRALECDGVAHDRPDTTHDDAATFTQLHRLVAQLDTGTA